ncbi:MAG: glycosyltransferase family 4 protein [Bacteroidetes bacterium]|nr:glycosyltransferase family 4 protein [Bacteroidota bacterium]
MAKRLKIGLIYSYDKDWIAGAYYILNLIHALNLQSDENKPELLILSHSKEEFDTVKQTGYPYLKFKQLYDKNFWASYNLLERGINKISKIITGKNILYREHTKKRLNAKLEILFPASDHIYFSTVKNRIFWIPDFQEHFLPHFFSQQEILTRKKYQKQLADNSYPIVFSSNNALNHFKSIYPDSQSKTFVLQFAVRHPHFQNIPVDHLLSKYLIDRPYFFCPNQFWAHKNHMKVLKAIKILKEQGHKNILVVLSGKESDHRNPGFFKQLKTFVSENGIENNVNFLGFIDRSDQLQLMNNAIAVIQPSLFEGWSTVIEDAKSMGQYVIASNLEVHIEQLSDNCTFFDPNNENELAGYLEKFIREHPAKKKMAYHNSVTEFGEQFIKIVNAMT